MSRPTQHSQSGAMRWWMPLLVLVVGTAGLIFVGWLAGVDMHAAGQRIRDDLIDTFHDSDYEMSNEAGTLRLEFDGHDRLKRATHENEPLPLSDVLLEDGYVTVTSLKFDDGELQYWRLPLHWDDELRESVRNPRWRLLARVHPRPDGEPAGLRVARVGDGGPGGKAGLRSGDVIVGVAGLHPPSSAGLEDALQHSLAELAPGGTLVLDVDRDGAAVDVSIPLEAMVTAEEWKAADAADPVDRYLEIQSPGRGRRRRAAQAQAQAQEAAEPQPPEPPAPPPAPPNH